MDLGELMKQKEKLQKKLGLDNMSGDEVNRKPGPSKETVNGDQKIIEVHSDAEPEVVEIKSDSDVEHLYDIERRRDRERDPRVRDRDQERERESGTLESETETET